MLLPLLASSPPSAAGPPQALSGRPLFFGTLTESVSWTPSSFSTQGSWALLCPSSSCPSWELSEGHSEQGTHSANQLVSHLSGTPVLWCLVITVLELWFHVLSGFFGGLAVG